MPAASDPSAPIPEPDSGLDPFRITHERGPVTRQIRTAAFEWGGEAAWEALLASVSPECRSRFQKAIGFYEWVESSLALELHEAWSHQQGRDDMHQRGEDTAREIFGGVQQWILRLASPGFLLQNVPRLYGFYYRGGRVNLIHLGPGLAKFEFRAWGLPANWFREGISAWLKVALKMTGAQQVAVCHTPPDSEAEPCLHRYEVTWQA